MSDPKRLTTPPNVADWIAELAKNLPEPTSDMDPIVRPKGEEARERARLLNATIPPRYRWARVEKLSPFCQAYARHLLPPPNNLVIGGAGGIGKTSMACALLWAWMRSNGGVPMFASALDLAFARIEHRAGHGAAEVVADAKRAPLLLIDDMGQEDRTTTNPIPEILWHRHQHEMATWFTTAAKDKTLAEKYGGGFIRRMVDGATCITMQK